MDRLPVDRLPVDLLRSVSLSEVPVRAHHAAASSNIVVAAGRRWGLICLLVLLALGGAFLALALMDKQYVAEAVLQLNFDRHEGGQVEEGGSPIALEASAMVQGELRIIRSRMMAHRVVERLHLADEPATNVVAVTSFKARLAGKFDELRNAMPLWVIKHLPQARPQPTPEDRAVMAEDEVMGHMTAESDNRSYLVTVRFTANDPQRAARIANTLAEEYITRRMERNIDTATKTVAWLDGQLQQARAQLREGEATVDDYRAQSGLLELGGAENLGQQRLRDLSLQRSVEGVARRDAQARLGRVQEATRTGSIPSAEDLKGSPQLRVLIDRRLEALAKVTALKSELGPQHPQVIQAQAALNAADSGLAVGLQQALLIVQGEVANAERAENDTIERLQTLEKSMIAGKAKETELHTRQAAIQALRDRVAALTKTRDQAEAIQQLRPVAASLIVPAEVPRGPVSPKPIVIVPAALAGSLGFGVFLASLLERRDRGFQSGTEVEPLLGTRCLGMVPELPRALKPRRPRGAAFEASLLAETVRSVGASLGLFDTVRQCRVVLVTSSVPGEGKSTFARALGECLVASGRRVLLVDGSPCREVVRVPDETEPGQPGDGFEALEFRSASGLVVLRRSDAASLATDVFGTTEFAKLLDQTRKRFDVVIIEGPAVMLVADSLVLGRLADIVVLLARWSKTRKATVAAALRRLHESSVSVDGVVLSRVDLARHAALKAVDLGAYYLKEKRFYEQVLGHRTSRMPNSSLEL